VNLFIEDVLSFENLVSTSDYCRKKNFANAINLVFCCLAKIGLENLRFCKAKQSLGIAIGSHLYLYLPTGRELRDYQIFPDELETIGTIGEILNDVTDEEADVAQELIQTRKDERVYIPLFFEVDNNNVLPSKG